MNDDDELTQALAAVAGSPGASGSALFEQSTASASGDNGAVNMVNPQKKVKQNFVTKKGYYIHVQSRSPNSHAGSNLIQTIFDEVDDEATAGYTLYYMGKDLFTLRSRPISEVFITSIVNKVKLIQAGTEDLSLNTLSAPPRVAISASTSYKSVSGPDNSTSFVKTERSRKRKSKPTFRHTDIESMSQAPEFTEETVVESREVTGESGKSTPVVHSGNGPVEYLNGVQTTPLYSREPIMDKAESLKIFARALMRKESLPVCTEIPQRCMINATFLVETYPITPMKSIGKDGLGIWINNSGYNHFYAFRNGEAREVGNSDQEANARMRTQYFNHKKYADFKRRILHFFYEDMSQPRFSLFVYYFKDNEHYIEVPADGRAKRDRTN